MAASFSRSLLLPARRLPVLIPRQAALIVTGTVFGGLIFGRLVSLGLDGGIKQYGGTIRALFVIDSIGFTAAIAAVAAEASF